MPLNEWKSHPLFQNLNQKIYVLVLFLFVLAGVGMYVGFWIISLIGLGMGLALTWLWSDVERDKLKHKIIQNRKIAMMETMAYVKIFLFSGLTVYQAIQQAQTHASPWMRTRLEAMLTKMDEDKSFRPFFDLARPLNTLALEQLMIALYQITQTGMTSVYLSHFFYVFDQLEGSIGRLSLSQFEDHLEGQHTWAMIGTSMLTLLILYSMFALIQGIIHGV